ncbi:MAG: response regulator, partial [Candidatus Neomarinimicrobiota bacterium]
MISKDLELAAIIADVLGNNIPESILLTADVNPECVTIARREQPDLILLEIDVAKISECTICQRLIDNPKTKKIPVILITEREIDLNERMNRVKAGVFTFLTKPVDQSELLTRILLTQRILDDEKELQHRKESFEREIRDRTRRLEDAISSQQQIEQALQASEDNYRSIFNAANDAIFIHEPGSGRIVDVNDKMLEMYEYANKQAIIGCFVEDISSNTKPYDVVTAKKYIDRAMAGVPQLFEWQSKTATGKIFWVEVNLKQVILNGQE